MPGMKDTATRMPAREEPRWRGPTIFEIALTAGVSTATVDRVLNDRGNVRPATRKKVLAALAALRDGTGTVPGRARPKIAFLSESGASFNRSLEEAVEAYGSIREDVECSFTGIATIEVEPVKFAQALERTASEVDGLVVVAREDLNINRAIRAVTARGKPVVCLTTDLPNSNRATYVGSNQARAGATAAYLIGRLVGKRAGAVLLVISAPYRCQEERELGFRRILRSEFPALHVEERVGSDDEPEHSYRNLRKYIREHGPPVGIYNVAGGNLGIARALQEEGLRGEVVFIGHELNANSRLLLESGDMDFVLGHDLDQEVALAVDAVRSLLRRRPVPSVVPTKVRIYTKFNCD